MSKAFRLDMVTPEHTAFSGEVESLVFPADEGYMGILAGHAPFLGTIRTGEVRLTTGHEERLFATAGGFVEISSGKVILLSESVEEVKEIDLDRARKARDRAAQRLAEKPPGIDFDRARAALERAENRLRLAVKRK